MSDPGSYDEFADIYDVWVASAPVTRLHVPFYVGAFVATDGPAVELGVGNGRICLEAARRGKPMIGVDQSQVLLDLCAEKARSEGLDERMTWVRGDFRDFELPEPAAILAIPFHSIGHLLTHEDKLAGLRHMREQLAPGGRVLFDHFIFNPDFAAAKEGIPELRGEYVDRATGRDALLWVTARFDHDRRVIRVVVTSEILAEDGVVVERRVRRNQLSWIDPEDMRALILEADLTVEACYGDFEHKPFAPGDAYQIWSAVRTD